MKSAFVVQHLHILSGDEENVKVIGVYSTLESARAAIERLKIQPGFCDHPFIVDPLIDDDMEGFHVDEYILDEDNWSEGFFTT